MVVCLRYFVALERWQTSNYVKLVEAIQVDPYTVCYRNVGQRI